MSPSAPPPAPSPLPALQYQGVSFSYTHRARAGSAGESLALENVSLRVEEGQRLGILGPNGGGKSTLLKITLGLLRGYSGEVRIFGLTPAEARARRLVGYVAQRTDAELAFPLCAREVVEQGAGLGLPPWKRLTSAHRDSVRDALSVVGASEYAEKHVGALSGGMLQRVLIARALAARPRLLLLDEPTVGIDPAGQQQFADLLDHLVRELRVTVVVVSHDLRTVVAGCDRVACLSRTLHSHTSREGLTPAVLAEVFRHDVAAIFGELHVDAHAAAACTDPAHTHSHPHSHAPASKPDGGSA